jgi:hypothetical protein
VSNKCYSHNGEDFIFDDFYELLVALNDDMALHVGTEYYEGDTVQNSASQYFCVDSLLDSVGEQAYDDAGEYAEDFPEVSAEKREELNKMVSSWLDANCKVNFYTVQNVEKKFISQEDVDDFILDKEVV